MDKLYSGALAATLWVFPVYPAAVPTYTKDVAPILFQRCTECHRAGEAAPMSLMNYKQVRPWAKAIKERVLTGAMPPWFANPSHGVFSNDRRLTSTEKETVSAWVDAGSPEGLAADMPKAPEYVEGWPIGKPDAIVELDEEVAVPASGVVPYLYYTVATNFTEDKWVQRAEIRPGNRSVVHHVIVSIQEPGAGESGQGGQARRAGLVGFAPGDQTWEEMMIGWFNYRKPGENLQEQQASQNQTR
jgi:hypothetical protein